jgi:beta-glucanase (GH16 family)
VYHTYQVDWQPDQIQWSVDGNITTTITKESTLSSDGQHYEYPSTPSRVQMSIWPAGISSSAQGTIDWAGGMIDWQSDEIKQNGYYSVQVSRKTRGGRCANFVHCQ